LFLLNFILIEVLHTSARAGNLPKKDGSGFAEHGKVEFFITQKYAAD